MENLAVSTPAPLRGANAQVSDASLAGTPSDLASTSTAGQSFVELLSQQVTLLPPQDEKPLKPALKEEERQASDVSEQDLGLALLGTVAQPVMVDPALFQVQALLPVHPGKNDKSQALFTETSLSLSVAVDGKGLPSPGAKTPDIAASVDAQTLEHLKTTASGDLQAASSPGQQTPGPSFNEVLAERKVTSLQQEPIQPQTESNSVIQLQSAIAEPVTKVTTVTQSDMTIPQKVGSESWGSGLGDKVIWVVGNQTRGAEIHLNPPTLGPLEIRINVSDGQANVSFMTQHASVREAIEAAAPRLREMLGDAGISMGGVSVNVGTFAQQQQQMSGGESNRNSATWVPETGNMADIVVNEKVSTFSQPLHGRGMVDLFA
jgi:flagellar hook-length control protein FliK